MRLALEDGLITPNTQVFDYGCGRGDDLRYLRSHDIRCAGWDPVHCPEGERTSADVVNLGYVVNVIEDPHERVVALKNAWTLAQRVLIVAARLAYEEGNGSHSLYGDGWLSRRGTFQKFYQQHELREWVDSALGTSSVPAGPGIFYTFRDPELRQSFVASRFRRRFLAPRVRQSDVLFERYKDLFEPLMAFVTNRGRLPEEPELANAREIENAVGSLRRAFAVIRQVTGAEEWDRIREERATELLMYLALVRFDGRPRYTDLSRDLQLDVRAFFSTYTRACAEADKLLFSAGNRDAVDAACRASSVGKVTHDALYVHVSALSSLQPILRVYEGCARAYIGAVEGANVAKLHRGMPQVSYLAYPEFDHDPHPALSGSLLVPLQTFRIQYRSYADSTNPPILHRKEEFVASDYPVRERFARLTRQEERAGLFDAPNLIGSRTGWEEALRQRGLRLSGHRLVKAAT